MQAEDGLQLIGKNNFSFFNTLYKVVLKNQTWCMLGCCMRGMAGLPESRDTWPSPSTMTPLTRLTACRAP